jgi:hypothetical protein
MPRGGGRITSAVSRPDLGCSSPLVCLVAARGLPGLGLASRGRAGEAGAVGELDQRALGDALDGGVEAAGTYLHADTRHLRRVHS